METIYYSKRYHNTFEARKKKKRKIAAVLITAGLVIILFLAFKQNKIPKNASHIASESENLPSPTLTPYVLQNKLLETSIASALLGTHGTYGISIKNLKSNESYALNSHTKFESASLYKLWVMAAVFKQIQAGNLKENEALRANVKDLNKAFGISNDSAEKKDGVIEMSVEEALYQMITISDNYAALILTKRIGLSKAAQFLKDADLSESSVGTTGGSPTTTASDIEKFYELLYNNQIADEAHTNEMLTLLKEQRLNGKIPKKLPQGVVIAHKTGELDGYTHDAGIVYASNGDYVIVILSKSDDPDLAVGRIANVSEATYNYFSSKN